MIYRTDSDGAITINIGPDRAITFARHRDRYRRYWLHAPARDSRLLEAQLELVR